MKLLLFIIICGMFLIAMPVIANDVVKIDDPLKGKTITQIIDSIISNVLLPIGGGVALIVIIVSGIQYMTAGGSEEKVTKARKAIMWALIGLAIVLSAKFIIQAIEAVLKGVK